MAYGRTVFCLMASVTRELLSGLFDLGETLGVNFIKRIRSHERPTPSQL